MGLFGSSDPTVKAEKAIAKEAKAEEKQLKHAEKELAHAEKSEAKAAKAEVKAQHAHEKAVKVEQKAAAVLNKANHKHDDAVNHQNASVNDVNRTSSDHQRITQEVAQKKAALENLAHQHSTHDAERDGKLKQLHQQPGQTASAVTNDLRTGEHVGPDGGINQRSTGVGAGPGGLNQTAANQVGTGAGAATGQALHGQGVTGTHGAPGGYGGAAEQGAVGTSAPGHAVNSQGLTEGQRTADAVKRM
ncbi:hypothetical protein IAT40_005111 [Kwoniella sp. CBS 6097]